MKKTAMLAVGMLILAVVGWLAVASGPTRLGPARTAQVEPRGSGVRPPAEPGPSPTPAARSALASSPVASSGVAAPPVTSEADHYAAAVAGLVFGMDTRGHDPGDYRDVLLGEADPNLSSTGYADLERLLDERIPTTEAWARMRDNEQWSAFDPGQTWEPGSWTQVVIAGQAEPGWVVRNVTGVQTTHYTENEAGKEAVRERTVTIVMRCPAPRAGVDRCRLVLVGGSVLP